MPSYTNLPRIELSLVDGQLIAVGDRPLTDSVLIIGPAIDGPTDQPVRVNNLSSIEALYGPIKFGGDYLGSAGESTGYSGNALVKGVREAMLGGASDIRVMRVGGTTASGTLTSTGTVTGTIRFTGRFPGRIYNSASVTITSGAAGGSVTISQPDSKGGDITISWSGSASGLTVAGLVDRINGDVRNKTVRAYVGTASRTAVARNLQGSVTLTSGADGTIRDTLATSKASLYTALTTADTGTFALLEDYEVDIIHLAGIYLDDTVVASSATDSVAVAFANYLGQRSLDHPIIGVIGTRPLDEFTRTRIGEHYTALTTTQSGFRDGGETWTNAGYFLNQGFTYTEAGMDTVIDAGAYLQVVAGDVVINDRDLGLYVESGAGIYAGTISRMKPHQATTHAPVQGFFQIPYLFTKAQLDTLTGGIGRDVASGASGKGAYVTIRRIEGRGTMFTRDVTAATRDSDFKDLQPLRIANAVHRGVKDIAFQFLGKPQDVPHMTALETQVKSFLDSMAESGALLGRDGIGYVVQVLGAKDPYNYLLGVVEIDIVLRPALQIKAIKVRVRLSL